MIQGQNETDSPERTLKAGFLAMLAGAAALAALLAGLAAGSTGVEAQEAGATYTGPIDVIENAGCGGGTISLTVSEDGSSISQLVVDGHYAGGLLINDYSDPAGGPFVVALDPGIAIGADGSFSLTFQVAVAGVDIAGQFDGDTVSGTFGVATFDCVDVPFSAEVGVAAPAPTAAGVPEAGSGPASSGDSTGLWAALAAAAGAVMLASGLALRRRA